MGTGMAGMFLGHTPHTSCERSILFFLLKISDRLYVSLENPRKSIIWRTQYTQVRLMELLIYGKHLDYLGYDRFF